MLGAPPRPEPPRARPGPGETAREPEPADYLARKATRHRDADAQAGEQSKRLVEALVHRQISPCLGGSSGICTRRTSPTSSRCSRRRTALWCGLSSRPYHAAQVLLESSRSVRDWLVAETERPRLVALLGQLDPDDLAYISESVDPEIVAEVVPVARRARAVALPVDDRVPGRLGGPPHEP